MEFTHHTAAGADEFVLTQLVADGDILVVAARGELDIATTPALRSALDAALESGHRELVVDLTGVSFIDSVGLATIVNAHRRVNGGGGRLSVVVEPGSYATLIIEVAGVDAVLDIAPTRDEALARIRGAASRG